MREIFVVYINKSILGCYSSVDKGKTAIKNTNLIDDKWEIMEILLDNNLTNENNVVCNYKTRDDKYFYNLSYHHILTPTYIVYNINTHIIAGVYSSINTVKKYIEKSEHILNEKYYIIKNNLDEPLLLNTNIVHKHNITT
jgi:hypothetical protein